MTPKQKRAILIRQIDSRAKKLKEDMAKCNEYPLESYRLAIRYRNVAACAHNLAEKVSELARHDAEHCLSQGKSWRCSK